MTNPLVNLDRFKHTSRPVDPWPPLPPGYVHLFSVMRDGYETAHFCREGEARPLSDLLGPHMQRVEDMLHFGTTLGDVIALLRREKETD